MGTHITGGARRPGQAPSPEEPEILSMLLTVLDLPRLTMVSVDYGNEIGDSARHAVHADSEVAGPNGGDARYGIAQFIQQASDDVLQVEEGSLYPALQRMLIKGWVAAEWKQSDNNRRARYYRLTPEGRKQMARELHDFEHVMAAITRVIDPA